MLLVAYWLKDELFSQKKKRFERKPSRGPKALEEELSNLSFRISNHYRPKGSLSPLEKKELTVRGQDKIIIG